MDALSPRGFTTRHVRAGALRAPRLLASGIALAAALAALCTTLLAQPSRPNDYEVMAAYLFNFGRFATWPAAAPAAERPFEVCILGQDPFGHALDATLAGETIDGKNAAVKRLPALDEVEGCRILFIGVSEKAEWPRIAKAIGSLDLLTVSDMPDFINTGGMIQFVVLGRKVRFEVNLTAVEQANVRLSSELLKVAAAVRRKPAGSGD